MPIMIGLTILLLIFSFGCFKNSRFKINRTKGIALLLTFFAYEGLIFYQSTGQA